MVNKNTKISEVMTPSPHPIGLDQPIQLAKKQMYQHSIRHLPVLEAGKCIGILSDRDIKLAYAVDHEKAETLAVQDVCATDVYEVAPDTTLVTVAKKMSDEKIGSAIIVEHGKVVGIFTTTDACKVIAHL